MASVDADQLSPLKFPDSLSNDDSGSTLSDRISLTDSLNSAPTFQAITTDIPDDNNEEINVSGETDIKLSNDQPTKSKLSLFKDKTITKPNLLTSFDSNLTRILNCLETNLLKYASESKGFDTYESSIDSQLVDIRLMVDCEKDCSLFENQRKYRYGFINNKIFKSILNEFDMRVMVILLNQYLKANVNISTEAGKNK
jgi:hypothetical protein